MPPKLPWTKSWSEAWWVDKLLVPMILVAMTGAATLVITPQILYLRDKKLAADQLKRELVEETATEDALLTNAAWAKEDALDAAFEEALEKQIDDLKKAVASVCRHTIKAPPVVVQIRQSSPGWSGEAVSHYHEQFRTHQVWATKARLRLAYLFARDDIRLAFDKLEAALGAYDRTLEDRATCYNVALTERDEQLHQLLDAVKRGTTPHLDLHSYLSRERLREVLDATIKNAPIVDSAAADVAENAFFAALQSADVAADAVASDRLRAK